jgi:site-specific DNA recombinase
MQIKASRLAILYAAKSTEDKHGSIPTQLADARAMAEREGCEVVGEYSDEAKSAYSGNRGAGLAAAQEHAAGLAAEGHAVAVFVQHSDRIARGDGIAAAHVVQHFWAAKRDGYQIRSVQDDSTFSDSADGLMAFVMGLRNHEDSRRKALATKAGIRRMVRDRAMHHGRAPLGYRWDGKREDRRLVIDEPSAALVRRIYRMFVADGFGTQRITDALIADGIPAPRSGKGWGRHTVANILDNPVYVGRVKVNGETFPGTHDPLVEEELWLRAQELRKRRRESASDAGRLPTGGHLLTGGLLRCGRCGCAMRARSHRPPRQPRYECTTRTCQQSGIVRRHVDEALIEFLENVVFDVDATREAITTERLSALSETTAALAAADLELQRLAEQTARIKADYRAGELTAAEWRELREELSSETTAAESEAARLRSQLNDVSEVATLDVEDELAQRVAALRVAVAGEITSAEGLDAIRAALRRVFSAIVLIHSDDEVVLVAGPASLDDDTPVQALPGAQRVTSPR